LRHRALRLADESSKIPTSNVELNDNPALSVIVADLFWPTHDLNVGHVGKRYGGTIRRRDNEPRYLVEVTTVRLSKPNVDVEASNALEYLPDFFTTYGHLHRAQHVVHVEAIPGDCRAIDLDLDLWLTGDLLCLNVNRTGYTSDDVLYLICRPDQLVEVVAEKRNR
jgi:hypothetical protein